MGLAEAEGAEGGEGGPDLVDDFEGVAAGEGAGAEGLFDEVFLRAAEEAAVLVGAGQSAAGHDVHGA